MQHADPTTKMGPSENVEEWKLEYLRPVTSELTSAWLLDCLLAPTGGQTAARCTLKREMQEVFLKIHRRFYNAELAALLLHWKSVYFLSNALCNVTEMHCRDLMYCVHFSFLFHVTVFVQFSGSIGVAWRHQCRYQCITLFTLYCTSVHCTQYTRSSNPWPRECLPRIKCTPQQCRTTLEASRNLFGRPPGIEPLGWKLSPPATARSETG